MPSMAASFGGCSGDLLAPGSPRPGVRPATTGPGDGECKGLKSRLTALANFWEKIQEPLGIKATRIGRLDGPTQRDRLRELFKPIAGPTPSHTPPPPSYEESLIDLPPDYTLTDALAARAALHGKDGLIDTLHAVSTAAKTRGGSEKVDRTSTEGVRNHVSKKQKKAAKQAQQSKSMDSDNEEKKGDDGGGDGGDGAPGGDGGDGGAGAGGDPPGGGDGGDNEEDWFTNAGGKKGKKKKKKNAFEEMEEEEKKREEEEAKKAEEAAAAAAAADAAATADTGGGAGAGEADPIDEWGTFATVGKKKKGKKAKNEPVPEPEMKFDDVDLKDDKAAPKLDLDLGTGPPGGENKSSGFSFGGWGSGWGSTGGSWGFGGGEEKKEPVAEDTSWGFSSSTKKDKKKKDTSGFDFNFDDIAGDGGDGSGDLGATSKAEQPVADDPWGGFTAAGSKKDKKKKRGVVEPEPAVIDVPPSPPVVPVNEKKEEEEIWSFGTSKKDKKKGKKGAVAEPEPEPEPVVLPEPVPAAAETKPMDDDPWGGGTWGMSAKDKKKAKKAGKGVLVDEKAPEDPPPPPPPPPAPVEAETGAADEFESWGNTGKKSKKKKAAGAFDWGATENAAVDVPPPPPVAPVEPENDWLGSGWGDVGKKSKKGKKDVVPEAPPDPPALPDPVVTEEKGEDDWFGGGWGASKKDKKGKKGKTDADPQPPPPPPAPAADLAKVVEPASVDEPKADDDWMTGWSTGTKKKGSKKDKAKDIVEVNELTPDAALLQPESIMEKSTTEDDPSWSSWGNVGKKDKKKGKKGLIDPTPPPAPTPPEQGLDGPAATLVDVADPMGGDPWSGFSSKKDKKSTKKGSKTPAEVVEEVPTLTKTKSQDTAKSKGSKSAADDIFAIVDEAPPAEPEHKPSKDASEEKKSSKSNTSGWGGLWGNSKSTSTSKDKDKDKAAKKSAEKVDAQMKADEEAFAAALGEDPDDILDIIDDAPKKSSSKDKSGSKAKANDKVLSKADAKSSRKSDAKDDPIVAVVDNPAEEDNLGDIVESKSKSDSKKDKVDVAAGWGFWGASSKSSKKATAANETKKEITGEALTNPGTKLTEEAKMPEFTWDDATSPSSKAVKDATTGKKKSAIKGSSIQDRIKALQGENPPDSAAKKSSSDRRAPDVTPLPPPASAPAPIVDVDPVVVIPPSPDDKKSKKSKSSSKTKKDADVIAPPAPPSPIPGGFPTDPILDEVMPSATKKSSSKEKRPSDPSKKSSKSTKPALVDAAAASTALDDLIGLDKPSDKLPTPPPEKGRKDDSRGHKKERPKVVRDQGSNSWGFWGATPPPKSTSKKDKDGASSPVKDRSSGLSRSKSARKAADKDPLEKASKSSGSDKDGSKSATKSRPSTSRGMSFSGIFGMGGAPSRSKSTRERASTSRRHSTAVGDGGLASPPPEDDKEISAKAAKVMGMARSKSTREKTKSRKVPDPYSLDSDDLVMVDGPADSARDIPPPDPKDKRVRRTKRESTRMAGGLGDGDDAVMVDAPRGLDDVKPDPAFDARPPIVRRATTSSKKPGLMGGLLGAFSSRPAPDRRQSKAYDSEDGLARRKRGSVYDDDQVKRLRREDRKVNRSRKPSDADGLTDAAPMAEADEAAAREARRADRKARRDREATEDEVRAARRKEREEARATKAREEDERLRREDERNARKQEERKARKAEREARRADEEDRIAREEDANAAERRERRRERERQRGEEEKSSRPKIVSDRRRSYMDDDEARRLRREERRQRRSDDQTGDYDKPRTSRRRSEYPAPIGDYFDKRNGEHSPYMNGVATAPIADGRPGLKTGGGDKTASWVHSISEDPPPPPPVEGTIVDAPLHFTEDTAPDPLEETTAREMRQKRAKDRDGLSNEDAERRRRRREGRRDTDYVKSSSGGSSHERRRSYAVGGPVNSMGFTDMGVKTWDGLPSGNTKRGSWFKKFTGF